MNADFQPRTRRHRPSGAVLVEAALVFLVFLGFIFLILDLSMAIFSKVTLQHAVRAGVRYAVTSQTSGALGQLASIKQVVKNQSMGILSTSDVSTYVTITFYTVSTATPTVVTGTGSNAAGNLVVVSVRGWPFRPWTPIGHSSASIPITVSSGDLIESSGAGFTPPAL